MTLGIAQKAAMTSPVLIIGAGVGGLALAQGLRLHGVPFRLFERRPNLPASQGHRFRLSTEALTAVKSVLSPELKTLFDHTAAQPNVFKPRYVDAQEFRFDPAVKVGEDSDSKPVDRSWLRTLLMLGIEEAIEHEKDFKSFNAEDDGLVRALFADGTSVQGSLLVGADGIWSRVRRQLQPHRRLLDLERWILWGRTPLTDELRRSLSGDTVSWYMVLDRTANAQAVIEPMVWSRSARSSSAEKLPEFQDYLYWAVSTGSGSGSDMPQDAVARRKYLEAVTESWHPELKLVLQSAPYELSSCLPVLSSKPDIELRESALTGIVTVVGDSSHAMSPMGGSGAATTLVNAADLASTISQHGTTAAALRAFEERMAARARTGIEHSFMSGQKFWLGKEWDAYEEVV